VLRVERAALSDMAGVYRVCLLTGDAGADATALYADPDLPGHVYAGPYLAQGGGTQLVVVDDHGIAGYVISTDDSVSFDAWARVHWWPPLRDRYPPLDDGTHAARIIRLIHEPLVRDAALLGAYPAHFHIDLLERARGEGLGRRLMERLLTELRGRGVAGVHMGVDRANANAIGFYEYLGFRALREGTAGVTMGMSLR
jgi:ribosomal protein S18 acetylase RimI-like enzyme